MLEDRYSIETPEGLRLDLVLAGVGTRIVAALIDSIAILLLLLASLLTAGFLADALIPEAAGVAVFIGLFIVISTIPLMYYVAFEVLDSGRSMGKRAMKLRVVRADGLPVGFVASMIRNLLRVVDLLPGAYFVGLVSVMASSANQRLGDMAANTLVIREQSAEALTTWTPASTVDGPRWDVSQVDEDQLQAIRYFLERRPSLDAAQQQSFGARIADAVRPVIGTAGEQLDDIAFLEKVWQTKQENRR